MAEMREDEKTASETAVYLQLLILRLAAIAMDVRERLSPQEIQEVPNLERSLNALEQVFSGLYGDVSLPECNAPTEPTAA
jgi:hypothetical protein